MTKTPILVAALLIMLAMIALPVDIVLTQVLGSDVMPGEIQSLLNRAETFGHGYGVLFIILTVWILSRCEFRQLHPLIVCSLGAGLMADLIKVCVGRARPHALPEDFAASTFTGFMPWWGAESLQQTFTHANQSFPSAHTATAFGLAFGLASMYPQGRGWFFFLASLVAIQRMVAGAHYLSDVLVGAAVGLTVATFSVYCFAERKQHGAEATVLKTNPHREFIRAA